MKKLMLSLALIVGALFTVTNAAQARSCTIVLKNHHGYELDRFQRYGPRACRDARHDCKVALSRWGRSGLRCQEIGQRPVRRKCEYSIVTRNGRGRILQSFPARGRDACYRARSKCENALWQRQRNDRNPRAVCQRTDRSGFPGRDFVTRSCTVDRVGPFGGFIRSYQASADGYRGTGVRERACQRARNRCVRDAIFRQQCITQRNRF